MSLTKVENRFRITEEFDIIQGKNCTKIPLTENDIKTLKEEKGIDVKGKYRFKVWDSNFNANNRNYAKVIPIVLENKYTTVGLCNHPKDEVGPDPKDIIGVEKNPELDKDGWLSVEFYPCGELGERLIKVIDAGGPVSVSSSCLGDLDSENYVMQEGFELERYFDWVFNPSNRLNQYADKIDIHNDDGTVKLQSESGTIKENNSDTEKLHRDKTVSENKNIGENIMPDNTLLETTLQMNIRSMIRDASKTADLYEKRGILTSAHSYASKLTEKDLTDEIDKEILEVDAQIKALSEKGKKADELSESVKTLTESKMTLEQEIKALKEEKDKLEAQFNTVVTMYEEKQYKAGETEMEKSHRMAKEICGLKARIRERNSSLIIMAKKAKIAEQKALKYEALSNTKVDASDVVALHEQIDSLSNRNARLSESVKAMRGRALSESKISRPEISHFDMAKRHLENKFVEDTNPKPVSPLMDEDAKMEQMLNH